MATIPENFRDIFAKKAFAHLATVGRDGAPQAVSYTHLTLPTIYSV